MDSDTDIDIEDPQQSLQAGIDAGHINIQNENDNDDFNITVMSAHAQAAQEKHQTLLKSIEEKRLKQNLRVPTDDNEVKQRLRALKEPICFFAEDAADRRDRLRDLIAKIISSGQEIPEFRKDRKQLEIDLATIAEKINADRPYFSAGNPWLAVARTRILKYSLPKAAKRVGIQLKQREDALPPNKRLKNLKNLSSFTCQASYYNQSENSRPLQCCTISPYLHGAKNDDNSKYCILFGNQGGDITVWTEHGDMKNNIHAHEERITGLAVMPFQSGTSADFESLKFISSSADGLCKLYNTAGAELSVFDVYTADNKYKKHNIRRQRLGKCAFHPMGDYFATTSYDRSWSLWDVNRSDVVLLRQSGHSTSVHCCAFHPDGSLVGTGDLGGIVRIWDLRSGRALWGGDSHAKSVLGVDFNVNGYIMASCSTDNTIKIWDLRKHSEYTIPAHGNLVSEVAFEGRKGEWAVSVSFDKTVRIWSMKERGSYNFKLTHEMKGHHSRISDVCISDGGLDGKSSFIVTASHDKTWKLWANQDIEQLDEFDDMMVIKKEEEIIEENNTTKMEVD